MSYRAVRGCLIGAAILIHGAVGVVLGDPPSDAISRNPYEQARDKPSRPEPPRDAPAASQQPEHRTYAADYERACDQPKTAEEADLCQQWRMAKASEELADLTTRQFWATLAEIAALVATVCFTAWAALAASRAATSSKEGAIATWKAAEAAIEANRLHKTSLELQHRPWLTITQVRIASPLCWVKRESKIGEIKVAAVATNIGITPAVEVFLHIGLRAPRTYIDQTGVMRSDSAHVLREEIAFVEKLRSLHGSASNITLFLRDILPEQWICSIPDKDIIIDPRDGRERDTSNEAWYKNIMMAPMLIIYVDYRPSFIKKYHQTVEVYRIRRKNKLLMAPAEGDIPVEELVLERSPHGGTYTN